MNLLMKRKIKNISKRVIRLYSFHFVCLSESLKISICDWGGGQKKKEYQPPSGV